MIEWVRLDSGADAALAIPAGPPRGAVVVAGGHCQVSGENDQGGFGGHKRWWLPTGWSHHNLCVLKQSRL
jgi:hypothetical protein